MREGSSHAQVRGWGYDNHVAWLLNQSHPWSKLQYYPRKLKIGGKDRKPTGQAPVGLNKPNTKDVNWKNE